MDETTRIVFFSLLGVGVGALIAAIVIKMQTDALRRRVKYEALLGSLGEGIVVTDEKGNVELINKQAEVLVGWRNEEVVGKKWYDIAPLENEKGERIPAEKRATQVVLTTGKARSNDKYSYVRRDGTKFAVGTTAAPIIANGKIVGVIAVFRDISHEKEVDRAKSEFVSLASHQLKTPLSAIKWFAEMLLSGDVGALNDGQKEYVDNINQSNERMITLVNSLLNISRIESGRIIVDPEPTDISKLLTEVTVGLKAKLEEKHVDLVVQVQDGLPMIEVDPKLISQVYVNLLTNAIKYSPASSKVVVSVVKDGDEVLSCVSDRGYGIPKEEQHRLFDKFYRGSNVVKIETDGTGLGLYLVKAIITSSQGRIWYESEEGKGTSFWFALPVSGMIAKEGEVSLIPVV